jgi:hypothetical protein
LNLIRDFGTSKDGQEGTFGVLEGFGKVIEFFLHEESGGTLRKVNTDHRRMSTVRSSEGVVYQLEFTGKGDTDVDVCEGSKRLSEFLYFFGICFSFLALFIFAASFLLDMESQVLKKHNLAFKLEMS